MPAIPTSVSTLASPTVVDEVDLGSSFSRSGASPAPWPTERSSRSESMEQLRGSIEEATTGKRTEKPKAPEQIQAQPDPKQPPKKPEVKGKQNGQKPQQTQPTKTEAKPNGQQQPEKAPANGQQVAQEQPKFNFGEMKKKADAWDRGELPHKAQEKLSAAEKEIRTFKSQLDAIKSEYETEKGRYVENQTWRMAFERQQTPEYKQNVVIPFQQVKGAIEAIAQRYGTTKNEDGTPNTLFTPEQLCDAATDPDEFERTEKLFALLENHPRRAAIEQLLNPRLSMLDDIAEKNAAMEQHAAELQNQINAKVAAHGQQQSAQQKAEMQKAMSETWDPLNGTPPELFSAADPEVKKWVAQAQAAEFDDSPMGRAMAARLPDLTVAQSKYIQKLLGEVAARDATIE